MEQLERLTAKINDQNELFKRHVGAFSGAVERRFEVMEAKLNKL